MGRVGFPYAFATAEINGKGREVSFAAEEIFSSSSSLSSFSFGRTSTSSSLAIHPLVTRVGVSEYRTYDLAPAYPLFRDNGGTPRPKRPFAYLPQL